jgi:hypothetical protein
MPKREKTVTSVQPRILEIDNHAKVSQVLKGIAGKADLSWYSEEVAKTARHWLRLGMHHLVVSRRLISKPQDWRSAVSRCYYAAYNVSKCVRYCINGCVRFDGGDHKLVGDLPNDFPDRASWSAFLAELRQDRNFADYEPWTRTRFRLSHSPGESIGRVQVFTKESKVCLRKKGWA